MKLIFQIAAGIILAVVILAALYFGTLWLMGSWLTSSLNSTYLEMCLNAGISKADCPIR